MTRLLLLAVIALGLGAAPHAERVDYTADRVTAMPNVGAILPNSGFEFSGELQPCESLQSQGGCFMIDGKVYFNLHHDLVSQIEILKDLAGQRVVVTVSPQ